MIAFANTWLLAFTLSSVAALLDAGFDAGRLIALTRGGLFGVVLLTSPVLYLALVSPSLPKSVFLPPLLWIPFSLCGGMPLPLWVSFSQLDLAVSGAQFGVAILAVLRVRVSYGTWWLPVTGTARFEPRHALEYAAICGLAVPLALALYVSSSAAMLLDRTTGGFVRLDFQGIHAEERRYVRGDSTVRLIPMVHVGRAGYYDEVLESLPKEDSIILAEGMRDENDRLSRDFSYAAVASALGLESQREGLAHAEGHRVENADLDVSALSPETLELVESAAAVLSAPTPEERADAWDRVNDLVRSPGVVERAAAEVIGMRNRHLLERIDESLSRYALVVVPWGAAHMPELEQGLLQRDFKLDGRSSRAVVLFAGDSR